MESIIITTAVVTAFSGILAFLLTLADRTIGNYGEMKLTINDDKEYIVEGGLPTGYFNKPRDIYPFRLWR